LFSGQRKEQNRQFLLICISRDTASGTAAAISDIKESNTPFGYVRQSSDR